MMTNIAKLARTTENVWFGTVILVIAVTVCICAWKLLDAALFAQSPAADPVSIKLLGPSECQSGWTMARPPIEGYMLFYGRIPVFVTDAQLVAAYTHPGGRVDGLVGEVRAQAHKQNRIECVWAPLTKGGKPAQ